MARRFSVSDHIVIALDPATIYAHISDPTQTPRWSPENTAAHYLASVASAESPPVSPGAVGTTGTAAVGTTFIGRNRRHGFTWCTQCTVTAADPGQHFGFRVDRIGLGTPRMRARIASWDYRLEPTEGGTLVTETWTDNRTNWPSLAAAVFDRIATRTPSFAEFNARNIRTTLRNLKSTLEADHRPATA